MQPDDACDSPHMGLRRAVSRLAGLGARRSALPMRLVEGLALAAMIGACSAGATPTAAPTTVSAPSAAPSAAVPGPSATPQPSATPEPPATPTPPTEEDVMNFQIRAGDDVLTGTLDDSAAARDFASLLPLAVTLTDYASTEKISDLPRSLSTDGSPGGMDPSPGDVTYYAPWGNLAIFYRDAPRASGLVSLGRLDGPLDLLSSTGPIDVVIEAAPSP